MNSRRIVVLLAAFALFASACGGGSADSSVATASDASEASDTSADTNGESSDSSEPASSGGAVADGGTPMSASSPIGAFFADGGGFETTIQEYTIKVEEEIVLCMAAQGFEFARSNNNFNEVQDLQNDLTIREWTSEFGYGISTSFDSIAQGQASDPNTAIVFGLSESEREVWVATLTGGEFGGAGPDNETPLEEQGCIGQALINTGGQDAFEGIEVFGEAYEEGEEALFDRREMVEAVDAWSRCMSGSGYPDMASNDDPEAQIAEEFDEVTAPMSAALDELTPEEGQALISGESLDLADLPDLDLDALRELQKREIDMALADLDCYEGEVQAIYEPLRDDFENGLLVEYEDELNGLKNIGS